jgi:acyl-CoA reductase-like NAD-dependent aldehyde dehydrogenase
MQSYSQWAGALAEANRSRFGLQAAVFSDSIRNIDAAYAQLDVGALVVNDTPSVRVDNMPYGGVKASGHGREGVHYAMESFTEPKLLVRRTYST